jgi:hypothetical protein
MTRSYIPVEEAATAGRDPTRIRPCATADHCKRGLPQSVKGPDSRTFWRILQAPVEASRQRWRQ